MICHCAARGPKLSAGSLFRRQLAGCGGGDAAVDGDVHDVEEDAQGGDRITVELECLDRLPERPAVQGVCLRQFHRPPGLRAARIALPRRSAGRSRYRPP